MNNAGEWPFPHFFGQYRCRVGFRIAGVDDDRQARFARRLDMLAKPRALLRPVAFVVIIIEACLANRDHTGMCGLCNEFGTVHADMLVGLMRVNADGCPHILFLLGKANDLIPLALSRRNIEHRRHPAVPRPL